MKKLFTFLLALTASVGMMNAKVTWNRSNISNLDVHGTYESYSKEGVTLSTNANEIAARWYDFGDESQSGIGFNAFETGGFTFSNTLDKKFTKIEMTLKGPGGWDNANLGSDWLFNWNYGEESVTFTVTWKGNASKVVDLVKDESHFYGDYVKSIVFYFEGDSEAPDPTYTIALQGGTANADKVTLSKTSAVEGATVTVTPDEEYGITDFKATYNTTEEAASTLDPATGAYSFTMPAADVTIEATIALKPVPEGDVFAGFTATAGSGGFDNEGSANLVDNKFTSADWTKWCADNSYKSVPTDESGDACWWIDFEASAALNLTGYILTTGNDTGNEHGRNPKNWVLKAKLNADDAWTTIATVTDDVTMKNLSFKDYKFFVDQSGPYQYFRFEMFANQGANVMQLCELRLIGTEAPAPAPVAVTGVTLDQNEVQMTVGDETLMLTATVAPDDATDKTVVWTSSDPSVATVANGLVTAVAAGTATITATATNGTPVDTTDDFSATCDVTVSASSDEGAAGALPGKFSVSASQVVYFSRGNLQASTTDLGANWTWAFAKKQYNCVAANASNTAISGDGTVSTNGTVDLFGWSTAATQYGIHVKPFNSTYSGDFVDWGSNPDLIAALGTGWRTLTSDEWTYLLDTRTTTSGVRYAKAEITDKIYPGTTTTIKGLIILPDDWSTDYHALASTNTADAAFTSNQITSTVWKNELEAHGAVFMPAAGYRMATSVYSYGDRGYYWSATPNGAENAYELIFVGDNVYLADNGRRFDGHSVRLVTETAPAPATPTYTLQLHVNDAAMGSVVVTNLLGSDIIDNGDGTYTVPEGAEVTILATPNEGYEFTGWKASNTICDFTECEFIALNTVDNPLTFDMYAEAAFMAEFAAVTPQPVGNSIIINESSHGSVVASSSSAAAGETITLTATPDEGYQLKSISGVYEAQGPLSETLNSVASETTTTGTKFQCVGTIAAGAKGWRVYNPGTANTLIVSSLNGTTLIEKIEFTSAWGNGRANNMLSVSAGTLSFNGTPATTVTINDINATSVTISGSGTNGAETWCITSVKVYYTATIENELEISDTENANVKTFTMVDSKVTISAEFEPEPEPTPATTTVTWKSTDFTEEGTYTSHKGIEVNPGVEVIDIAMEVPDVTISGPGSFSTTNSNLVFTKIEVSGGEYDELSFEGEGWSDSEGKRVWEGQAATVPFNLGTIYTGDEGDVPWTIVFTLAPATPTTPTVYNSGSVALSNLKVGDILMAGVTLTDDSESKVKFVPSRLKIITIRDSEFTVANFVNSLQTPLLGENAAMTFPGGLTITPINEEREDGNAWVVTEINVAEDTPVALAGITYSGSEPEPEPTVWTALKVGDVIKVGDKIEVPAEGDGSWGINGYVLRNTWGPYTLIRADIAQENEWDDPVVTEAEDGAYYVFKAENSDFYPLSNLGKGTGLVVTGTSDGLVVTAAENKEFTVAVHENGSVPTGVENVQTNEVQASKLMENGVLYILHNGVKYNVQGARVR